MGEGTSPLCHPENLTWDSKEIWLISILWRELLHKQIHVTLSRKGKSLADCFSVPIQLPRSSRWLSNTAKDPETAAHPFLLPSAQSQFPLPFCRCAPVLLHSAASMSPYLPPQTPPSQTHNSPTAWLSGSEETCILLQPCFSQYKGLLTTLSLCLSLYVLIALPLTFWCQDLYQWGE